MWQTYNLLNILYSVIINPYISLASDDGRSGAAPLQSVHDVRAERRRHFASALLLVSGWLAILSLQSSYMVTTGARHCHTDLVPQLGG